MKKIILTLTIFISVLVLGGCDKKSQNDTNATSIQSENNDTRDLGNVESDVSADTGHTESTTSGTHINPTSTTSNSQTDSNGQQNANVYQAQDNSHNDTDENNNNHTEEENDNTSDDSDDTPATGTNDDMETTEGENDNNTSNDDTSDNNTTTENEEENTTTDDTTDTNTTSDDNNTAENPDDNTTTDGNDDNTTTEDNTTTRPTVTLSSLKLSINKTSLNIDENTTLEVMVTYSDGTSKEVTDKVEWVITSSDSIKIEKRTLIALKDTNTTIKAKLDSVLSNTVYLTIAWVVNGHILPPEPDKTLNDSTLLGIDANSNGVRDDVERWIYEEYKDKHPIYVDIAMQASRGYKLILEAPERAKKIHDEVRKARHCEFYYKYSAKYFNEPILIKNDFNTKYLRKKIYFNTLERKDVYIQYDTLLSGDSYSLPSFEEEKKSCDFNTNKYGK